MKKPHNLKKVRILLDKKSFHGLNPYVNFDADGLPLRITLDGIFGIDDLRWFVERMLATQQHPNSNAANR